MADETTDVSTTEQLSICVCYVHIKGNELEVCEEFLGFCAVSLTDAETITSTKMKNCGLNMEKLCVKGFEWAYMRNI